MKKIIALVFLIACATSNYAQGDFKKFRFGLKAAPNVSWLKTDLKDFSSDGVKVKFPGSYGLMAEFGLSNNASFATGLEITTIGGALNFPDSVSYLVKNPTTGADERFILQSRVYNLQYVDIPLLLKMKTPEIGAMTYFGMFGFNPSFKTKAIAKKDAGKYYTSGNIAEFSDIDINNDIGLFRVALNVGLGVEYNLAGSTSLVIGANYSNGFTNALKGKSKSLQTKSFTQFAQNAKSNFVALTVGILF